MFARVSLYVMTKGSVLSWRSLLFVLYNRSFCVRPLSLLNCLLISESS